jgi:hypothetical protein
MRYTVLSCLLLAACGGQSAVRTGGHDGGDLGVVADAAADAAHDAHADAAVDAHVDAAVDAHVPDATIDAGADAAVDAGVTCTGGSLLYESATLPASGAYPMLPAVIANGDDYIGVRFTTITARTITCLGATIYNPDQSSPNVTMLLAIVPLDPTTHLPMTTDLSDAVGYTSAVIPYYPSTTIPAPPMSAMFPASIALPAGTWGLVVASNRLGVPYHEGWMPITNVSPVGSPSYFHYTQPGDTMMTPGTWIDGLNTDNVRMFVMGN